MKAISDAYDRLRLQWSALGQSPDHGLALLTKLKACYPQVPFVFYPRKITPEDVIRLLRAGAAAAIRKGALKDEELLARLATAQEIHCSEDAQSIRLGEIIGTTGLPEPQALRTRGFTPKILLPQS